MEDGPARRGFATANGSGSKVAKNLPVAAMRNSSQPAIDRRRTELRKKHLLLERRIDAVKNSFGGEPRGFDVDRFLEHRAAPGRFFY
jgi:hypothetical protein